MPAEWPILRHAAMRARSRPAAGATTTQRSAAQWAQVPPSPARGAVPLELEKHGAVVGGGRRGCVRRRGGGPPLRAQAHPEAAAQHRGGALDIRRCRKVERLADGGGGGGGRDLALYVEPHTQAFSFLNSDFNHVWAAAFLARANSNAPRMTVVVGPLHVRVLFFLLTRIDK